MKKIGIVAVCSLFVAVPAHAAKEPQVSGLALQQIQSRDVETTVDIAFPAVMTVLQDSGYRIQEADRATGLISAIGSAESKLTFNIWFGVGKKKEVPIVSAFIESRSPSITRIRLNFVMSKAKDRNVFSDEKPVSDPAVYRDAFERIDKEIFTRQAMNATPAPMAAAVTAPVASPPASPETLVTPSVVPSQ